MYHVTVNRLQETTPARTILKYQLKSVRPQGCLTIGTYRFQETLKLDCKRVGYLIQDIATVAAEITCWCKFVRAATGDG